MSAFYMNILILVALSFICLFFLILSINYNNFNVKNIYFLSRFECICFTICLILIIQKIIWWDIVYEKGKVTINFADLLICGAKRLQDKEISKEENLVYWATLQPLEHKPWRILAEEENRLCINDEQRIEWTYHNYIHFKNAFKKRFGYEVGPTVLDFRHNLNFSPNLLAGILWTVLNDPDGKLKNDSKKFKHDW